VIMSTASKLHKELVLRHPKSREPVCKLWTKVYSLHESKDASLHYGAWMMLFSAHESPDESYAEYYSRMEGAYAHFGCIIP